ncbi:MAG TPA: hypothetical protein VFU73_03840 [Actinocrinis sp.]|nr:hypothetical protein [Actinocrinis sp.]
MANPRSPASDLPAPAFYARRGGPLGDWVTVLHPPYTLWHISYAAIGAALAPRIDWTVLGFTVLAFALAVGVAAHALDEWNGRPLRTGISSRALWIAALASLAAACALGVAVIDHSGAILIPFILAGVVLVFGYNLELFNGALHTDLGFALAWGAFPAAVGYVAQAPPISSPSVAGAVCAVLFATGLSAAQRRLSTPARLLRRRTHRIEGTIQLADGTTVPITREALLAPLDGALRLLSYTVPALAAALLLARVSQW